MDGNDFFIPDHSKPPASGQQLTPEFIQWCSNQVSKKIYDDEKTQYALNTYLRDRDDVRLPLGALELFQKTITSTSRISTGLAPSNYEYKGTWFSQAHEPTCAPWSVINAVHAVGGHLNPAAVQEMLNVIMSMVLQGHEFPRGSTNKSIFQEIILRYPDMGVTVSELPVGKKLGILQNLKTNSQVSISKSFFKFSFNTPISQPRLERESKEKKDPDTLYRDINAATTAAAASTIKETVDSKGALVVGIFPKYYAQIQSDVAHSITIVGYKINEQGHLNVQIIDSDRGVLWASLEHILFSYPQSTYVVHKT